LAGRARAKIVRESKTDRGGNHRNRNAGEV
jgi:hypothetical protein